MDKVTKKSSPRNTKAWTLEDVSGSWIIPNDLANVSQERALLQGRLDRVPYKQIGARIGKTDLACRLHFHQMVMAKKTPGTAPGRSIIFLSSEHPPEVHRLTPMDSTSAASMALSAICENDDLPVEDSTCDGPRLYGPSICRRSHSTPHMEHDRLADWQPVASPYTNHRKRIDGELPGPLDLLRGIDVYKQRANDFWSTVPNRYKSRAGSPSPRLGPAFLRSDPIDVEERTPLLPRITLTPSEPTSITSPSQIIPRDTPRPHGSRHSRSISDTSIAGRCSVEALLNHGRT